MKKTTGNIKQHVRMYYYICVQSLYVGILFRIVGKLHLFCRPCYGSKILMDPRAHAARRVPWLIEGQTMNLSNFPGASSRYLCTHKRQLKPRKCKHARGRANCRIKRGALGNREKGENETENTRELPTVSKHGPALMGNWECRDSMTSTCPVLTAGGP